MVPRRISNRLTFLVERLILRGAHYRLLVIAGVIGLVSVAAGTLVHFAHAGFSGSWADAVWWAFLRMTDPGYLGDDQGRLLRTVSTIVTVLGYVVFLGALVAIMTQWLNEKIRRLESGYTPIAERNHVLILGWTNRTTTIVREILLSQGRVRRFLQRRGARRLRIVILADLVSAALSQELRERLGPLWKERQIILRTGTPLRIEHLKRVDFRRAAAILLPATDFAQGGPAQADTHAIKTLLSITSQAESASAGELPLVVAEVFNARKVQVARRAYGGPIEVLASDAIVSRLIAQNVRHRNLSHVYNELLTHGRGNEIYIRDADGLAGATIPALADVFPTAVVLGAVRRSENGYQPILNPPHDFAVDARDRLVLLARKFDLTQPADVRPAAAELSVHAREEAPAISRRVLILGWSHKAPALLREFDSYPREHFEVDVLSAYPTPMRETAMAQDEVSLERVKLRHVEGDYTAAPDLQRVEPAAYDHVVLLASDRQVSSEESDARTILGHLLLRDLLGDAERPHVLIELLDPGNVMLFRRRPGEVIISPLILSHMLAQVALRRELRVVFDELFGPGGAEIYFRPASRYGIEGQDVTFRDLQRVAAARQEVAIGVRVPSGGGSGITLNPRRDHHWTLARDAEVIVLSTDPRG